MSIQLDSFFEDPTEDNVVSILRQVYKNYQPQEQVRWREAMIDTRMWAGDQTYTNDYYGFNNLTGSSSRFYFNIIQPLTNMVTGYQREHRKRGKAIPVENSDNKLSTQLTQALYYVDSVGRLSEKFSRAAEQSMVTGLELVQPHLNYSRDPVNGVLDYKHWSFNSFIVDPYFKAPDMSDANFVITQEFVSKQEALLQYPTKESEVKNMSSYRNSRDPRFYFLPENYGSARQDLMIKTSFWFRRTKKIPTVVNYETGEILDFRGPPGSEERYVEMYQRIGEPFSLIDLETATWDLAVLINEKTIYFGHNPMEFHQCPFVPIFWNRDPQIPNPALRSRGLVRSIRDVNFLLNRRIILNHDISESSINTGYLRLEDGVVNEEDLMKVGQGKDIIIKEDAAIQMGGIAGVLQKINPNIIPPSNLELANQLQQLAPLIGGINEELLGAASDDIPGILAMARQGAGLITLQKYFDQWDLSLKYLNQLNLEIITRWWSPQKFTRIFGEEPVKDFIGFRFQQYDVIVEEGANTATQQNSQFLQMLKMKELGFEIPPDLFFKYMPIESKDEIIAAISQQQQMASEMQQQKSQLEMSILEQQLQNLQADTAEKIGLYKERVARAEANRGLDDERKAEVEKNMAASIKLKAEAYKTFLETLKEFDPDDLREVGQYIEMKTQEKEQRANINQHKDRLRQDEDMIKLPLLMQALTVGGAHGRQI